MLMAYQGIHPTFFRKTDVSLISRVNSVAIGNENNLLKVISPAAKVTLTHGAEFVYLLHDADARAAFREVLFESMDLEVARKHFPEAWED